jgi:hypothetical protein
LQKKDYNSTGIKISRELFEEKMATKHLIITALKSAELLRQNLLEGSINDELLRYLLVQDLQPTSINLDTQPWQPEHLTLESSSDNNTILGQAINVPGLRFWLARTINEAKDDSSDKIKPQDLKIQSLKTCEVSRGQSKGLDIRMFLAFLTSVSGIELCFLQKIDKASDPWSVFYRRLSPDNRNISDLL